MISYLVTLWNTLIVARLRAVLDRQIVKSASAIYLSEMVNYAFPLVTVPYIARVLGPDTWGHIVFIQAIGLYVMIVVDYAFDTSATREVSRISDDPDGLADIVAGVFGARLVLVTGCVLALGLGQLLVPALRETGWLLWLGVLWYVGIAWRPFWFFLGIERVATFLAIEVTLKGLGVAGILIFVNRPQDGWMVLAFQGGAAVAVAIIGLVLMYRVVAVRLPSRPMAYRWLREGWDLFVYRASTSVYNMGNTIILGFVAPAAVVGYYGGAERISRVLTQLMYPLLQSMFPRASGLAIEDPSATARMARASTLVVFVAATIGSTILYFLTPFLIRILLGPGYEESVPTLRILLLVLPILGASLPLSMHWMIPMGLERMLTKITIAGGFVHVPLAVVLGSSFGHIGVAWALVVTESLILTAMLATLLYRGISPFRFEVSRNQPDEGVLR